MCCQDMLRKRREEKKNYRWLFLWTIVCSFTPILVKTKNQQHLNLGRKKKHWKPSEKKGVLCRQLLGNLGRWNLLYGLGFETESHYVIQWPEPSDPAGTSRVLDYRVLHLYHTWHNLISCLHNISQFCLFFLELEQIDHSQFHLLLFMSTGQFLC